MRLPLRPLSLVVLAAAAIACGDGKPAPAGAGPAAAAAPAPVAAPEAPQPDGPPETWIDDEFVLAAVVASARSGAPLPPVLGTLPPRVSPVRVAVRALHDHLVGVNGAAQDWDGLVAALERLAQGGRTTVDHGALAPLVTAWKGWTQADRDAEAAHAEVYARRLDLLRSPDTIDARAVSAEPKLPAPPAKSPAFASLLAVRAALVAAATPGGDVPATVSEPFVKAVQAFDALGWPGGLAPVVEVAAARLERGGKTTLRSAHVLDLALDAYARSGDPLRKALVVYQRIDDAERQNDVRRATQLSRLALDQIDATGTRGREPFEVLVRLGNLSIALGKPADAAPALTRALAEIEFAKLDPVLRTPVGERLATALWFLGRFGEAVAAADAAASAFADVAKAPTPEQLAILADAQEIGARARVDGGCGDGDGAKRFLAAAETRARLPGGANAAATARLFAADAWHQAGGDQPARKLVDEVLAAPEVSAGVRAHAASVLRDIRAYDDAERELSRAESEGPPALREALAEEWARLHAAQKDFGRARPHFAAAAKRATKDAGDRPAGYVAARVYLDWARMERDAGDPEEAARLANEASSQLIESPYVVAMDDVRKFWVEVQRQRGLVLDAERVTRDRLKSGPPGRPSARKDAEIDLFVTRLAAAALDPAKWAKPLEEAAAALSDEGARAWAARIVRPADAPVPSTDLVPFGRTTGLAAAAQSITFPSRSWTYVGAMLQAEPPEWEVSRWMLDRMAEVTPTLVFDGDALAWVDRHRGRVSGMETTHAIEAALAPGDAFAAVDAVTGGDAFHFVVGRHASPTMPKPTWSSFTRLTETGGLAALWNATWVDPSPERLAEAAAKFLRAREIHTSESDDVLWPGAKRVIVSTCQPFGVPPLDLVPRVTGGKPLLDEIEWCWVASPSEFLACAKRPAPTTLSILRSAEAPLTERHAVVPIVPVDDATRARFATLVDEARRRGLDASAAVRDAKLRLRAEWTPDPKRPRVPPWASFVLRGAP